MVKKLSTIPGTQEYNKKKRLELGLGLVGAVISPQAILGYVLGDNLTRNSNSFVKFLGKSLGAVIVPLTIYGTLFNRSEVFNNDYDNGIKIEHSIVSEYNQSLLKGLSSVGLYEMLAGKNFDTASKSSQVKQDYQKDLILNGIKLSDESGVVVFETGFNENRRLKFETEYKPINGIKYLEDINVNSLKYIYENHYTHIEKFGGDFNVVDFSKADIKRVKESLKSSNNYKSGN